MLAAGGSLAEVLPPSIQRAYAIDPAPGSTYLDAEHIVILMQENRSFDHMFGTLRGVRGFNDPRAMTLPNGNPVWLQSTAAGETYAPFRLDIKNTKATWMGSLPHSWVNQAEARNEGCHDRWLSAKASSDPAYSHLPLTLGFYSREDLPFYYALADAFTICDQNFCSSLTATEPNRLHLWTGTVRSEPSIHSWAHVRNEDMGYDLELNWTTFPERLEQQGISWRIYQNEISLPSGLKGEADAWLSNYDDNTLEYFTQYRVRFSRTHRRYLAETERSLAAELDRLNAQTPPRPETTEKQIAALKGRLESIRHTLETWTEAAFAALPAHEQNLHRKAFTTNEGNSDYRELTTLHYRDGSTEREMQIPKGDVLYQFREDVRSGKLPMVSWLVAPERFSDHPSSAWYGAWYLSETLNILTQNPEIWKKTIFILCYDENDGYFDHVPPFVPPQAERPETGKASSGLDTSVEHVSGEQEAKIRQAEPDWKGRPGPIGLGFRVPLVIASPWSRGGYVCSQLFDHTSILQFLETFLSQKTGHPVSETNISAWRRTICGDLTTAFRPFHGEKTVLPQPFERDAFLSTIHQAQFRAIPDDYKKLNPAEIAQVRSCSTEPSWFPQQESGVQPACPLPYELEADGMLSSDRKSFSIHFAAGREKFGEHAVGAPFRVYTPGRIRASGAHSAEYSDGRAWDYAVSAGDRIADEWRLEDFASEHYHLCVYAPNGFYREFLGTAGDPQVEIRLRSAHLDDATAVNAELQLINHDTLHAVTVVVEDAAYGGKPHMVKLSSAGRDHAGTRIAIDLTGSFGWYDLRIRAEGVPHFEQRYAGHIETGRESFSDPLMGRSITKKS
ncbi:phospholipase C, phosphocholine-specific [Acidipila sp. 4G-K13]|nr:phospholipase C, phosphocholine-specific [Paracidobacterium acidisoli]